jgi:hypothetical protein
VPPAGSWPQAGLFVLDAAKTCNAPACSAFYASALEQQWSGQITMTVEASAGKAYVIVADSQPGDTSAFTLTTSCQCCTLTTKYFVDTFDTGPGPVTTSAPAGQPFGWSVVNDVRYTSPPGALYYGNPTLKNFETTGAPNQGLFQTQPFALPAASIGVAGLWWKLYADIEAISGYDLLTVEILETGSTIWRPLWDKTRPGFGTRVFQTFYSDLSAFAGKTVQLRWSFDSKDPVNNMTEGLYVDDIAVTKCQPKLCTTATDCDDGLSYTSDVCAAGKCANSLLP